MIDLLAQKVDHCMDQRDVCGLDEANSIFDEFGE